MDLLREIAQTIRMNKVRTFLTGIAVSWGVFMLIVLLAMARAVTDDFEENMASERNARIRIYSGMTSVPFKGNREGRSVRLTEEDLKLIPEKNKSHVKEVYSYLSGGGTITSNHARISQQYEGVFPSVRTDQRIDEITAGRFINDRDIKEKAKVMVLPQYYAEQLFPPDGKDALGSRVECQGLSFKIIGVFDSKWNRTPYIPFTTARMIAKDKEDLGTLTATLKDMHTERDGTEAEEGIRNTLSAAHNFDPKDENAVYISNYFLNSLRGAKATAILNLSVWILGILTLLTGIVGISNIMFVTVKERTHEIGIRRAIGAKPHQILIQIIAESIGITVIFGYLGIVFGMAATQIVAHFVTELSGATVDVKIAAEVLVTLVICGALAGIFPALRALKIKPVEALRDE